MMSSRGLQKTWRDSACLMMITGPFRYRQSSVLRASVGGGQPLNFGQSSLPICLENVNDLHKRGRDSMELLFVQRSSKAKFMANTYVFPGGVLDKADYSPKWQDIFCGHSDGKTSDPFDSILSVQQAGKKRLPLYSEVPSDGPIAGEIAFRICAIRETFEEAGVLLVRDVADVAGKCDHLLPGSFAPAVKSLPDGTKQEWRKRVHENAEEFITMCKELQCVPDIWSLIEWSNWLTPRNLGRRYDTVFYLCLTDNYKPISTPDSKETSNSLWLSPRKCIEFFESKEIDLAPPQFGEIGILSLFGSAPCLHSFALLESIRGEKERRTPVRVRCKDDCILSIMNNDDLYPAEGSIWLSSDGDSKLAPHHPQSAALSHVALQPSDSMAYEYECPTHSVSELRDMSEVLNRMEFRGTNDYQFVENTYTRDILEHVLKYKTECQAFEESIKKSKL